MKIADQPSGRVQENRLSRGGGRGDRRLPLGHTQAQGRACDEAAQDAPRRSHVLVIEDDAGDRDLLTACLGTAKYDIQSAEGGALGLHLATEQPPEIILLDIHLPDIDGYEVCRQLRQDAQTQPIPIVIITGSDDPALHRNVYAAGAQACIMKPFRKEALLTVVEAVLTGVRRCPAPAGGGGAVAGITVPEARGGEKPYAGQGKVTP